MTTTTAHPTVLTQAQRYLLAHDYSFGGGSLLRAAIAANPRPDLPFIRPSGRSRAPTAWRATS